MPEGVCHVQTLQEGPLAVGASGVVFEHGTGMPTSRKMGGQVEARRTRPRLITCHCIEGRRRVPLGSGGEWKPRTPLRLHFEESEVHRRPLAGHLADIVIANWWPHAERDL